MDFKELREQWEEGLEVKYEKDAGPDDPTFLVVLESFDIRESCRSPEDQGYYHCHRYFKIGDNWEVSVDGQNVSLDQVWEWLMTPQAIPA